MFCSFHCSITDHFITGEKNMTKTMNLQGVWDFQLDTGCTGIHEAFYTKNFDDTISLPGTTSMAQKGTFSDKMETGTLTDPYLYEGYAWYSKEIHLEPEDVGREILLYLERTRVTMVWVNDLQPYKGRDRTGLPSDHTGRQSSEAGGRGRRSTGLSHKGRSSDLPGYTDKLERYYW